MMEGMNLPPPVAAAGIEHGLQLFDEESDVAALPEHR
jgi:hypothetical protein